MPVEDEWASKLVERAFRKRGIKFSVGVRFAKAVQDDNSVTVSLEDGKTSADLLLVAVGRGPTTAGLGYEQAGVTMDRGFVIPTSDCHQPAATCMRSATSCPAYSWHTADSSRASSSPRRSPALRRGSSETHIPKVTYCDPEIASVGITEARAKELYGEVETLVYDLGGNGKSQILKTAGAIKMVRAPGRPAAWSASTWSAPGSASWSARRSWW